MTTTQAPTLEGLATRVDAAVSAVNALDPPAQVVATELKEALDALHSLGLRRIITDLRADPRGRELLFALVDAPEVLALFQLHGLVRGPDLATRTRIAFDGLVAQGVEGSLVRLDGDVAVVSLPGAVSGCGAKDLRDGVTKTLMHSVSGLGGVRVEAPERQVTLIPLSSLTVRGAAWTTGPAPVALTDGRLHRVEAEDGASVVLLAVGAAIGAFRNACPRQGEPLDAGRLDTSDTSITCPAHGLRFDALSGVGLSDPGLALIPVEHRLHEGQVQVRPPRSDPHQH